MNFLRKAAAKVHEAQKEYERVLDSFPYIFRDVCNVKRIAF
jgi:hypothetical protein